MTNPLVLWVTDTEEFGIFFSSCFIFLGFVLFWFCFWWVFFVVVIGFCLFVCFVFLLRKLKLVTNMG